MDKDFEIKGAVGFTVMSNYHMRDKSLSWQAKGILSTMLSLPPDWDYSMVGLSKLSTNGITSTRSAIKELKDHEYVEINQFRDSFGHIKYKYTVYYIPKSMWLKLNNSPDIGLPHTGKPHMDELHTENQTQLNTNNKRLNIKDKLDKEKMELNKLTINLINKKYIEETESSILSFNSLFNELLDNNYSYQDLLKFSNYIVDNCIRNGFKDENGNEIKNKMGYFKNAIMSSISRFYKEEKESSNKDDLFYYDWLNDDSNEDEMEL